MKFAHPEYFLLILLIPLMVAGAVMTSRRRDGQMILLIPHRLRSILYHPRPRHRRWLALASFMCALLLLITALASPSAGFRVQPDTIRGRNIIIAIDVSRSMFAEDVNPNRFHAAKASALELLDRFPDDRIGIIAFSGTAWIQAPLTIDHNALRDTLQQLDRRGDSQTDWIPRDGSDLASAVRLAIRTLHQTGQRDNTVVLLSDGETHHGGVEQASHEAAREGVTVFAAGFGTPRGAFIPDPSSEDGHFHDREGTLVITRLDSEALLRLAERTGGVYSEGAGRNFLTKLEVAIQRLERFEIEGRKRRITIPHFQWFLGPSMLLFVVGMLLNSNIQFRRPAPRAGLTGHPATVPSPRGASSTRQASAILALILPFLPAPSAEAGLLPRTPAERALSNGDHKRALVLFAEEIERARGERKARLQLGAAAAAYRLQQYQSASSSFSGALLSRNPNVQSQAHFGLGNTQFYKGLEMKENGGSRQAVAVHWEDSIDHFGAVIALVPRNREAQENRDYVKKQLEEWVTKQEQDPPTLPEQPPSAPNRKPQPNPDPPTGSPPDKGDKDNPGNDQHENGEPKDKDSPPKPAENSEENQPDENESRPDANEAIRPRPGETPEEFARRILRDNADFELSPLPRKPLGIRRPKKDW